MAKNNDKQGKQNKQGTTVVARAPRPKTPAQLAKKAANIAAYKRRCEKLRKEQEDVAEMRLNGRIGDDAHLLSVHRKIISDLDRQIEEKKAREYVSQVLSGPHGAAVGKFLGREHRPGPATKVAMVVKNYLATQGWEE
jgi:hypothetical protein